MKRREEWDDFLGVHVRVSTHPRRQSYNRTFDYQPTGWNSPVTKRIVGIYWRVTITLIKVLIGIPLSLIGIGAFWLLWVLITL